MKITKEIELKYGHQSEGDSPFTRNARLLQSIWRLEIGEINMGIGPTKKSIHPKTKEPTYYGNMLLDGEKTGKNFFYTETLDYAQKRVNPINRKAEETFDEYRLFNNLLSSMPMAFNLFHPLMMIKEKQPELLNQMMRDAFPQLPINRIDDIGIEYIPTPTFNYTKDKSAMDAFILFSDEYNNQYIIAIEMKYTDSLGTNTASLKVLNEQIEIIKELNLFTNEAIQKMRSNEIKLTQIYRNFILTEKFRQVKGLKDSFSIIMAPKDHPSTDAEINSLTKHLNVEFKETKLFKYCLESFVKALKISCPEEYTGWLDKFYDRYLDFNKLEKISKM